MCCLKLLTQFKSLESCILGTSNENFLFQPLAASWTIKRSGRAPSGASEKPLLRFLSRRFFVDVFLQENEVCDQIWTEETLKMCPSYGNTDKCVAEDA